MNDAVRSEIEQIRRQQEALERELTHLSARLKRLESAVQSAEAVHESVSRPSTSEVPSAPPAAVPPIIGSVPIASAPATPMAPPQPEKPVPVTVSSAPPVIPPASSISPEPRSIQSAPSPPPRSFEMRLGTYWLVRVGVVMLLTGLVFFGNYAYHRLIGQIGVWGKVALLYGASGLLLGFGSWWQRRSAAAGLRNYGQVLFAAGLAGVYFTTYAAHHVPHLRVISSALVDGVLLLAWAGCMAWFADRRKSEVLALFAVGLAFYTSIITRVGAFTLYSNLVLTAAAVFFLVRHRWVILSATSLAATYAGYAFWRFLDGSGWRWSTPDEGLWLGAGFLICYWVVFTAAVFLSRTPGTGGGSRAAFLTFNNVAFVALFVLTMAQTGAGGFWKFALVFGAVLLGLCRPAARLFPDAPIIRNSYLTQGLLMVTVGIISRFAGLHLALLLGAESVVLLTLGFARRNLILKTAAFLTGALAVGWGVDGLRPDDWRSCLMESVVSGFMLVNAFWSHRHQRESSGFIRFIPAFFTILALTGGFTAIGFNMSFANLPVALAIATVIVTFFGGALRVREWAILSQGYLIIAQAAWIVRAMESGQTLPWWNAGIVVLATLALSQWWQRQRVFALHAAWNITVQVCYALAVVVILRFWIEPRCSAAGWIVAAGGLALVLTVYAAIVRFWWLALAAQLFVLMSVLQCWTQMLVASPRPEWMIPLVPIVVLLGLSLSTLLWFRRHPGIQESVSDPILHLGGIYRWIANVTMLVWVWHYIPASYRIGVLVLIGSILFLASLRWSGRELMIHGAVFTAAALILFWWPFFETPKATGWNLIAILAVLAQERIAATFPLRSAWPARVHTVVIVIGAVSLWLWLSRWVSQTAGGLYLTASWSALALVLFLAGLIVSERVYRWVGLAVLAGALGRVMLFDVWRLGTVYRILSFMAIGLVLLVLGFLYNKYQEKFREWL